MSGSPKLGCVLTELNTTVSNLTLILNMTYGDLQLKLECTLLLLSLSYIKPAWNFVNLE